MTKLKLKLSAFVLMIFIGVLVVTSTSGRNRRDAQLVLLDLIEDYCDDENSCKEAVKEDLIRFLSNEPYDYKLDAGTSRTTLLLERIDDKCEKDQSCVDSLLEVLTERILGNPTYL